MSKTVKIAYAPDAFQLLKGIFCVYKPSQLSVYGVKARISGMLCRDLNMMKVRPPEGYVEIKDDPLSESGLTVVNVPSVADNPLVVGPRYQLQDFRISAASRLGYHTSGLCVLGSYSGRYIKEISEARYLRVYQLCGRLGKATDNFHESGKVVEKSTFVCRKSEMISYGTQIICLDHTLQFECICKIGHVSMHKIDKVLANVQAAHQKQMFHSVGVDIKSQAAYELASQGLVRPSKDSPPIIYGIKCTHLELPYFTIEVQCINENEVYLMQLINNIGLALKTNALCSKVRQIRYGNFTLDHALLKKHWTIEHIINNIMQCKQLIQPGKITPAVANLTENPYDVPALLNS